MLRRLLAMAAGVCAMGILGTGAVGAAERVASRITAAVADSERPAEDRQRDANRKPAETLQFAGIRAGDTVVELIPGRGYFTRIISKVVGPKGRVYALSPPRRPNAAAEAPDPVAATKAIADDPVYSNVTVQAGSLATVSVSEPADVVFTAQNYHDLHNVPGLDIAAFNKSVFDTLKPGGLYVVLDHAAEPGSGTRDTSTLHRIDEESVKTEALAAGFVLAGESNLLRNPQDPHTAPVSDPSIRGATDQFILKFRKPAPK